MRRLAWIVLVSCKASGSFDCETSDQCTAGAAQGTCEPTHFCSFPDPGCPQGRRYDPSAGNGLGGQCVGDDVDAGMCVPVGADEDSDGLDDACDPCPVEAEYAGNNPDNDAVTGFCDPNPTAPGDQIVRFAGFASQPSWLSVSGTMTFMNGKAFGMGGDLSFPPTGAVNETLAMKLSVDADVPAYDIEIIDPAAATTGVRCKLTQNVTPTPDDIDIESGGSLVGNAAWEFMANTPIVATFSRRGNQFTCKTQLPAGTPLMATGSVTPSGTEGPSKITTPNTTPQLTTRLDWLLVVTSP